MGNRVIDMRVPEVAGIDPASAVTTGPTAIALLQAMQKVGHPITQRLDADDR